MKTLSLFAAMSALAWTTAATAQNAPTVQATDVVRSLELSGGVHPGQRRNHIKGTCAAGEFVADREVAQFSRSALFSGKPVPVVARFSLAGGDPAAPDVAPSPRGLALEFRLPGGSRQHMTMLNLPVFVTNQPAAFNELILAGAPDPATGKPDPKKIQAFFAGHPEAAAFGSFMKTYSPPANYFNATYFSIHTFKFIDAKNVEHLVRWRFVPQDGDKPLSDAEKAKAAHDFLEPNLLARVKKGAVKWDMIVYVGEPGDPDTDPTKEWPEARKHFKAGTLVISQAAAQPGAECEKINFDPTVMADGIATTNDPILMFRSPAYAISFGKRLSGQ